MKPLWRFAAIILLAPSESLNVVNNVRADTPPSSSDQAEAYRRHGLDPATPLDSRVKDTAEYVLKMFKEDGRTSPRAHVLTEAESRQWRAAIETLPPVHRRILKERLRIVSFLDGMPNTALTSAVNFDEPYKLFDITINASILRQNVSEWLTQKERTCFDATGSPLSVSVEAGTKLDALVYVFLHEATHIVDACERITPAVPRDGKPLKAEDLARNTFSAGVWSELTMPVPRFRDPVRSRVRFYSHDEVIPIGEAQAVYESLRKTPFASLYGSANWLDDLAEYVSVYHITEVMKQPFRIVIRKDGNEVLIYEPMKSDLVRGRIGEMKRFY